METCEAITLAECLNDGSTIYAYRSGETGLWTAYGISAYLAFNLLRGAETTPPSGYSERLQMPAVAFTNEAAACVRAACTPIEENASKIVLHAPSAADMADYRLWTNRLRRN